MSANVKARWLMMALLGVSHAALAATTGLDTPSGVNNLPFSINGATIMNMTTSGVGIGIGENAPNAPLQVAGEISVGNNGLACGPGTYGAMRYNSGAGTMEYCSPSGWSTLGVPAHAVQAFNLATCPAGWSPAAYMNGRVALGTGNSGAYGATTHGYGQQGGEELHHLTIAELPAHNFYFPYHGGGGGAGFEAPTSYWPQYSWVMYQYTNTVGSDVPFNELPPYTALTYCEKN